MSRELMDYQGEAGTVHPATWAVYSDSRHPTLKFLYWYNSHVATLIMEKEHLLRHTVKLNSTLRIRSQTCQILVWVFHGTLLTLIAQNSEV